MKKKFIIVIISIILISNFINMIIFYLLFNKNNFNIKEITDKLLYNEPLPIKGWKDYHMVLHAGGAFRGLSLTNAKEAVIQNYLSGNKVIELDFLLTSDNKLIASHDYNRLSLLAGKTIDESSSLAEILNEASNNYLTLLCWDDVVDLLIKFPDMYIITDTKDSNKNNVIKAFTHIYKSAKEKDIKVLKRVIPQIYTADMYDYIEKIYKFEEYAWTLYQIESITPEEIIDVLEANPKIKVLTMPIKAYEWQISIPEINSDFINEIKKRNVLFYVHTLNDITEIYKFYEIGVWGFFTDYISENFLEQNNLLQYKK